MHVISKLRKLWFQTGGWMWTLRPALSILFGSNASFDNINNINKYILKIKEPHPSQQLHAASARPQLLQFNGRTAVEPPLVETMLVRLSCVSTCLLV